MYYTNNLTLDDGFTVSADRIPSARGPDRHQILRQHQPRAGVPGRQAGRVCLGLRLRVRMRPTRASADSAAERGDLTDAVIFDRAWIVDRIAQAGLAVTRVVPSEIKRLQWTMRLRTV